jgi:hypothetical protein
LSAQTSYFLFTTARRLPKNLAQGEQLL